MLKEPTGRNPRAGTGMHLLTQIHLEVVGNKKLPWKQIMAKKPTTKVNVKVENAVVKS